MTGPVRVERAEGHSGDPYGYLSGGYGYESNRAKLEPWVLKHYIEEFDLSPGQSLLDAGSGDGFWSSVFAKFGFRVSGFDLSPEGVEVARQKYKGIEFQIGDAQKELSFPKESFDIVFCRSIGHLNRRELMTSDSLEMADNLLSCVKPGGLLLASHYTKRDGGGSDHHAYHRVSELVELFESCGDVFKVDVVNHYVQIGVQHWDSPRSKSLASSRAPRGFNKQVKSSANRIMRKIRR